MPQMMPLNWLMLFLYFILIFFIFNIIMYFNFLKFSEKNNIKKYSMLNNWKW